MTLVLGNVLNWPEGMTRNSNKPWFVKNAVSCDWGLSLICQYHDARSRVEKYLHVPSSQSRATANQCRISGSRFFCGPLQHWAGVSEVDLTVSVSSDERTWVLIPDMHAICLAWNLYRLISQHYCFRVLFLPLGWRTGLALSACPAVC